MLIIQMILATVIGSVVYTIIGVAPGTDETAVLAPYNLSPSAKWDAASGYSSFFISTIITKKLTDFLAITIGHMIINVLELLVEHTIKNLKKILTNIYVSINMKYYKKY